MSSLPSPSASKVATAAPKRARARPMRARGPSKSETGDPAAPRGQLDHHRGRGDDEPGEPSRLHDDPGPGNWVDDLGVATHLAIGCPRGIARSSRVVPGIELLPPPGQFHLAVAPARPTIGGLKLVERADEVRVELESLRIDFDEPRGLLRTRGPIGPVRVGESAPEPVPGVRVAGVVLGDEEEVAMSPVELTEVFEDDPPAVVRGEVDRIADENRVDQSERLLVTRWDGSGRSRATPGRRGRALGPGLV